MKSALRLGLLLASGALLPSCWHEGHPGGFGSGDWVHVTVQNTGTVSANVHAEADYWSGWSWENHTDLSVAPGQESDFYFQLGSLSELRIWIFRSTDGLELLDQSWDRSDLDHLDDHVTITVNP
ncbi:MAG TPA: hypothetical protein VEN81_17335 [Planctomycetota bacterium]|jgi:hypothetical protein|nr:hypothetical protein [Planctomycetota bacterium]